MSQLTTLKSLLGNVQESDAVLQFYLDLAQDIICERRHSNIVEASYLNVQILMAIELFNKRGAEGQKSHEENGIARIYSASDLSPELIEKVPYMVRTPYSTLRIIE